LEWSSNNGIALLKLTMGIKMNTEMTTKKDILWAVGFALLLAALSFPLSILGIKFLNLVLGQIQL
jgi:hypothetical protein